LGSRSGGFVQRWLETRESVLELARQLAKNQAEPQEIRRAAVGILIARHSYADHVFLREIAGYSQWTTYTPLQAYVAQMDKRLSQMPEPKTHKERTPKLLCYVANLARHTSSSTKALGKSVTKSARSWTKIKGYYRLMITGFAHKGLERFYRTGSKSGIQAQHAKRLRLILTNLDQAESSEDMDLPGLALHELSGTRKEIWAVRVSRNWRVTFRFVGRDAEIVNYEDYY